MQVALFLAAAQLQAGEIEEAAATLSAVPEGRRDAPAYALISALTAEAGGRLAPAELFYGAYLESPGEPFRLEAEGSLARIAQQLQRAQARAAIAAPPPGPPDARLVLILPVAPDPGDPDGAPIAEALVETLVDDLGRVGRIRAVPRSTARAAVAAMGPDATPAQVARPLGAGWVVQATLASVEGDSVSLTTTITSVAPSGAETATAYRIVATRARLTDLEQQLALAIHQTMRVELTEDDYERLLEGFGRPTESWRRLGQGLLASDADDFQAAAGHFARALAVDSDFQLARRALRIAALAAIAPDPRALAWSVAEVQLQRTSMLGLRGSAGSAYAAHVRGLGERQRAALSELLGPSALGGSILDLDIELVIP